MRLHRKIITGRKTCGDCLQTISSPTRVWNWHGLISFGLLLASSCVFYPISENSLLTHQTSDSSLPCLYDSVSQTYKQCFHVTAEGKCAHFGAPCPPDYLSNSTNKSVPCLYDPDSGSYKECFHVTADGSCAHFGNPCPAMAVSEGSQEKVPCLYDPESGSYKECFHVTADGKCAHFGAPCSP